MARALFPREHGQAARMIAQLAVDNPFAPDRWERERSLLGGTWREPPSADPRRWGGAELSPNLEALAGRARELLEPARVRLPGRNAAAAAPDAEVYQDLAFLVIFHDFSDAFDDLIERSRSKPAATPRARFYGRFVAAMEYYLPDGPTGAYQNVEYDRIFAVFFQIRRAFHHIQSCIVGASEPVARLRARVWQSIFTRDMHRYQRSLALRMGDTITLVTGPSGSGKELVAQALGWSRFIPFDPATGAFAANHLGLFFPINLSALSPTLIESELFGHRRGSFTGALEDRPGYLESCGPFGSVFLDEIGEIDPAIQVKLLRVLQTRAFTRIGDTQPRAFEGKLMAATNRDLEAEMAEGGFRRDFFFRLCADRVRTPALGEILAETPEELRRLVYYIAARLAGPAEADGLAGEVMEVIAANLGPEYPWPGNFRELEQCVSNVLVHGEYDPVETGQLATPPDAWRDAWAKGEASAEAIMRQYARRVYELTGSYERAGRRLGLDRRTVRRHVTGDA